MATARKEKDLQEALMQAIFHGYLEPAVEAGKCLNEHFFKSTQTTPPKPKLTGRQVLDFVFEKERREDMEKVWQPDVIVLFIECFALFSR